MPEAGLIIEGVAADWSLDRESESFEPGSFDAGLAAFMQNPVLAFMHASAVAETIKGPTKYVQLGRVLDLHKDPERGLLMKAWFPRPAAGFLRDVYDQVKAGIMRGLSVGGMFRKRGSRIHSVDLQEISIAPKPVAPGALITSVLPVAVAPTFLPVEQGKACPLPAGAGQLFHGDPIVAAKAYVSFGGTAALPRVAPLNWRPVLRQLEALNSYFDGREQTARELRRLDNMRRNLDRRYEQATRPSAFEESRLIDGV